MAPGGPLLRTSFPTADLNPTRHFDFTSFFHFFTLLGIFAIDGLYTAFTMVYDKYIKHQRALVPVVNLSALGSHSENGCVKRDIFTTNMHWEGVIFLSIEGGCSSLAHCRRSFL